MNFDKYVQELNNFGKQKAFSLSISLRTVLLFWYSSRVTYLLLHNDINIFDYIIFMTVLSSMAINLFFWKSLRMQNHFGFIFFSSLESFLIVYSAIFLDDLFLLFLLAGSNTMTTFMQNKKITFTNGLISFLLYTAFSLHQEMQLAKYLFNITLLLVYFKINYFVVELFERYKQGIKNINIERTIEDVEKNFFFHNRFATHGCYTFESEVLQSEEFGGDFIALQMLDDKIIGIVGDINSHGNEVFSGAVVAGIVFQALSNCEAITPKTILENLNNILVPIDERNGGSGLFFVFSLNFDGVFSYAGGLFDGSVKINNTTLSLNKITIIGQKPNVEFKNFSKQLNHSDIITIVTDGWGGVYNKLDDKSKLKINYFGIPKKQQKQN